MNVNLYACIIAMGLIACQNQHKPISEEKVNEQKADSLIALSIKAHGHDQLQTKTLLFTFRNQDYSIWHQGQDYVYTKQFMHNDSLFIDSLKNGSFSRWFNKQAFPLTDKHKQKYAEALNSVAYFTLLPYKLSDKAVRASYLEAEKIEEKLYHKIAIQFDADGGGTDYQDHFMYWINAANHQIDFLAYQYQTNGGGARFRKSIETKITNGIRWQNYVNYKLPADSQLTNAARWYENGQLQELSRILNRQRRVK